jgi:hypothetical protein
VWLWSDDPIKFWTFVIVLASAVAAWAGIGWKHWKLRSPFKSEYTKRAGFTPLHSEETIDCGKALDGVTGYVSTKTELVMPENTELTLHLELIPKVSEDMSMIDVRFIPEKSGEPEISSFQDLTPPARLHNKPAHQRNKGVALNYDPLMPLIKGGKALDYLINVHTHSKWHGRLSAQVSLSHIGVRHIRIKTEIC